jgi:uncharacterized protein (TIRG00374 family)
MNPKKKLVLIAKILLSGFILAYLFYLIPLKEIINSILNTDLHLFAAGLLLAVPINYFSAVETQYLTRIQGLDFSALEILKIHLTTNFYGLFLPGILAGGAVKWYKFSKTGKKSSAAAVVFLNRFLEVLMIVFVGIIFSFPAFYSPGNQKLFAALILTLLSMVILYFLLLSETGLGFILKIILALPLPDFLKKMIRKFSDAMLQFNKLTLKEHFKIIGLLFMYHALGVVSFFCFAKSLDINLNIWIIGWIRSAISLAIMLPLSFAGLGIREGSLVFLLGQYGVKPDLSMALSFLFFSKDIMSSLLGGFFELKDFTLHGKAEKERIV